MRDKVAFFLLHSSLGVVFLLFGIGKFQNDYWARTMATMPLVAKLPWPTKLSVWGVGGVEVCVALLLITGFFLRQAAITAAVLLASILVLFRFQEMRDIALLGCALFIALRRK